MEADNNTEGRTRPVDNHYGPMRGDGGVIGPENDDRAQNAAKQHEQKCGNCRFFNPDTDDKDKGYCHKRSPESDADFRYRFRFPCINEDNFCGDWEEKND